MNKLVFISFLLVCTLATINCAIDQATALKIIIAFAKAYSGKSSIFPELPKLPSIPTIPKAPTLPNLPTLPSFPPIPIITIPFGVPPTCPVIPGGPAPTDPIPQILRALSLCHTYEGLVGIVLLLLNAVLGGEIN